MQEPWRQPPVGGLGRAALSGIVGLTKDTGLSRGHASPRPAEDTLTPEPRPQSVVIAVQKPVQNPGEDGDVVIFRRTGGHLR